ncbi:MAG: SDR family oxidoreductase [Blastomonas sp.]
MPHMLIFGLGYSASRLAERLHRQGWSISATGSKGDLAFDDRKAVERAIGMATHILSSVPPDRASGLDPVLAGYGEAIRASAAGWIGYLSSTGVYGDTGGAWVDESSTTGTGRRSARSRADQHWQELDPRLRIFRLPGIYGPGRSPLDRVRDGTARRIAMPGQMFSRVHVDDIAGGIVAAFDGPAGIYNLADDMPAPQEAVIAAACRMLGVAAPPLQTLDEAGLSPQARAFYAENRRVANGRAKRMLGWRPLYPDYRSGLAAILREELSGTG